MEPKTWDRMRAATDQQNVNWIALLRPKRYIEHAPQIRRSAPRDEGVTLEPESGRYQTTMLSISRRPDLVHGRKDPLQSPGLEPVGDRGPADSAGQQLAAMDLAVLQSGDPAHLSVAAVVDLLNLPNRSDMRRIAQICSRNLLFRAILGLPRRIARLSTSRSSLRSGVAHGRDYAG